MRIVSLLILGLGWMLYLPVNALEPADSDRAPDPISLTSQEMKRLESGEVLLRSNEFSDEAGSAVVLALFNTRPEVLWNTLADCQVNYQFVAGLLECEVTESTKNRAVSRQVVKRHWYTPRLEYRFATRREPYQWIRINLLDGDLESMQGSWLLQVSDSGLLVRHEIMVKPKLPAPRWLIRRTVQRDTVAMLTCLRAVTGASLDTETNMMDLDACPGNAENQ